MNSYSKITLKPGREKSLLRRHPWIFSGAIKNIEGEPASGETVVILSGKGQFLAYASYSPQSQIQARVWSFEQDDDINDNFFRQKIQYAIDSRQAVISGNKSFRVLNSESDGLPGVIVDKYGDFLVGQFLTAGAEYWKNKFVELIGELIPNKGFYERSDVDVRKKEGLPLVTGCLSGDVPPEKLEIIENGVRYWVDPINGHKTGFYLDQRDNRQFLANFAKAKEVLNCFCYTGGFGVAALKAGAARVCNLDASADALQLAADNCRLNGIDDARYENLQGDAFQLLRKFRDSRRQFDIIVMDPPKFIESKHQLEKASRGYKDVNLLAFKLLRPGGMLFTFSCSGLLSPDLFQKIIAGAALDAGKNAKIIKWLYQAGDHPVALNFPEGTYLKGLVCQV